MFFASFPNASPALPENVCREAAQWLVALQADPLPAGVEQQWRAWRSADPLHEQAWQQIESCLQRLGTLPPLAAARALSPKRTGRRRAIKALSLVLLGMGGGVAALQSPPGRRWRADLHTATAEHRALHLTERASLTLAAGSALDIRRTDDGCHVRLLAGEVFIDGARDTSMRMSVKTAQGTVSAVGAGFSVRQFNGASLACVFDGGAEVHPLDAPASPTLSVSAGEQAYFNRMELTRRQRMAQRAPAWIEGMLVADDMRLGDFLESLAGYHRRGLSWSSKVEDLRLSGTYPLNDTRQVLQALEALLPVRISEPIGLWTRVSLRQA